MSRGKPNQQAIGRQGQGKSGQYWLFNFPIISKGRIIGDTIKTLSHYTVLGGVFFMFSNGGITERG